MPTACGGETPPRQPPEPALSEVEGTAALPRPSSWTLFCGMIRSMAKNHPNFEVTCPCCSAVLKIDTETRAVIAHTAAVKPKTFADMEAAAKSMREQDSRRESIFQQSVEAHKHASDLLEKKFQEAVKKAKETPDTGKPIRDFDLD